jgi:hypothetical protein
MNNSILSAKVIKDAEFDSISDSEFAFMIIELAPFEGRFIILP